MILLSFISVFLANGWPNQYVFGLKPSALLGKSFRKIRVSRFGEGRNKHTVANTLTSYCFTGLNGGTSLGLCDNHPRHRKNFGWWWPFFLKF